MSVKNEVMTPGSATQSGDLSFAVLTQRSDFLRASRGKRDHTDGFVLQGWNRRDDLPPRIGFTCSKKVGNAVARNRAKRRLREIARLTLPAHAKPGWDYVLVGRANITATLPFDQMLKDMQAALQKLHRK